MDTIINPIYFSIGIAVITILIALISAMGKFENVNILHSFKRYNTKSAWALLTTSIMMSLLLFFQEKNNQFIGDKKDSLLSKERLSSEKRVEEGIKRGIDSSNSHLFDQISNSFAKQGYILDSVKKNIIKLDTIKNQTINNYSQISPSFSIDNNGFNFQIKDGFWDKYKIKFRASDAGVANINVECSILTAFKNNTLALGKDNLFPSNLRLMKGGTWEIEVRLNSLSEIAQIYIFLKGSYTTLDGLKKYPLKNVLLYNPTEKKISYLLNNAENRMIKEINDFPKNKISKLLEE